MRVLFASRYVDPVDPRSNRNILGQAKTLQEQFGAEIAILTWPNNDLWSGPVPVQVPTFPALRVLRNGIPYAVISAPQAWNDVAGGDCISEQAWEAAVSYGTRVLGDLRPDILHLHHRSGFWWLLASAQALGIPTVYTNYDWGVACLRTLLVTGSGSLCDGVLSAEKCAACIKGGRSRLLAALNERLVESAHAQRLVQFVETHSPFWESLRSKGAVSRPAVQRASMHLERVHRVFRGVGHLVTPSEFGRQFFHGIGVPRQQISVLPWSHAAVDPPPARNTGQFTATYIGRVSPEKGVHSIFSALEMLQDVGPVHLRVAGAVDSEYGRTLKDRYPAQVGRHMVEWLGWSAPDPLLRSTDVLLVPSVAMDNTPMTLIEAMAYKVAVVATDVPSISGLIRTKGVGYLAEYMSPKSLANAIRSAVEDKELIRARTAAFPTILSPIEYAAELMGVYKRLMSIAAIDGVCEAYRTPRLPLLTAVEESLRAVP